MNNEIKKDMVKEVAAPVVEKGFVVLATMAGFPEAAFALPLAKGLILGLLGNCFNDCAQMTLSATEKKKLNQVSSAALQTFREMAEKDGVVAWEMNIDPAYIDYAYEVAEHATLEAIRQSEKKKIDILGRYYGRKFYKGSSNWHDMHQIIKMVGSLTFRQLVIIRLIDEGFKGLDEESFISNPSVCVEINRLKDYGIWQTGGITFGINESRPIKLKGINKTNYSNQICEDLMLDRISDEDVQRVIDSFDLKSDGTPQEELTMEEYKQHTDFSEVDEQEVRDIVRKHQG